MLRTGRPCQQYIAPCIRFWNLYSAGARLQREGRARIKHTSFGRSGHRTCHTVQHSWLSMAPPGSQEQLAARRAAQGRCTQSQGPSLFLSCLSTCAVDAPRRLARLRRQRARRRPVSSSSSTQRTKPVPAQRDLPPQAQNQEQGLGMKLHGVSALNQKMLFPKVRASKQAHL